MISSALDRHVVPLRRVMIRSAFSACSNLRGTVRLAAGYLWRAVDQHRVVLDVLVQRRQIPDSRCSGNPARRQLDGARVRELRENPGSGVRNNQKPIFYFV
jgi:hypothetical protein